MPYPETAVGFAVHDHKDFKTFKKHEYKLKKFEEYDIDIAIDACGVCGSDVHTTSGGWGDTPLPLVAGHEIVGRAIKVGSAVKTVKVGDRVGVGAQISADLDCDNCKASQENYCPNLVDTYGAPFSDGTIGQGGFASHIRAHEYFTFRIPDNIETSIAAPMLCAGLTVYSPLVRLNCGPGKKVAIIGIGGLGHFALLWAKALGAEVYAISHSDSKKDDALKMGAKEFINTNNKDWNKDYKFKFDIMLSTVNNYTKDQLTQYIACCKVFSRFHLVGLPEKPLPELKAFDLVPNGVSIGASHIGNRQEMLAMLELASKQNIKSWVQTEPISAEGCKKAFEAIGDRSVRYRTTLVDFDKAFGERGPVEA